MFENKRMFAERVATFMHMGQEDKAGEPYINHVRRVAERVEKAYPDDETAIIAAWLHDTVEDTTLTLTAIRAEFGAEVADAVEALSRNYHHNDEDYYSAVIANDAAMKVKVEDLYDNVDPNRLDMLPSDVKARLLRKYKKATDIIEVGAKKRGLLSDSVG